MSTRKLLLTLLLSLVTLSGHALGQRHSTPVPPTLEIEVLDPGSDSLGNPAVRIEEDGDQKIIDIPPVVLVHRYYYTGDRTFQAQLLPGGPSIIVANHPKTGERCYIEAQMLPGAPRVTYRANAIVYDYGENGITIRFGKCPVVKYRSGRAIHKKVGRIVHAEQVAGGIKKISQGTANFSKRSGRIAYGLGVVTKETAKQALTPVAHIGQMMPFGKILFSSDLEARLAERSAQHKREAQIRRVEKQRKLDELTYKTIR